MIDEEEKHIIGMFVGTAFEEKFPNMTVFKLLVGDKLLVFHYVIPKPHDSIENYKMGDLVKLYRQYMFYIIEKL